MKKSIRKQFKKGDRVKSTLLAKQNGLFKEQILGVVMTNSKEWSSLVSVQLRGQKSIGRYSIDFWNKDSRNYD